MSPVNDSLTAALPLVPLEPFLQSDGVVVLLVPRRVEQGDRALPQMTE